MFKKAVNFPPGLKKKKEKGCKGEGAAELIKKCCRFKIFLIAPIHKIDENGNFM